MSQVFTCCLSVCLSVMLTAEMSHIGWISHTAATRTRVAAGCRAPPHVSCGVVLLVSSHPSCPPRLTEVITENLRGLLAGFKSVIVGRRPAVGDPHQRRAALIRLRRGALCGGVFSPRTSQHLMLTALLHDDKRDAIISRARFFLFIFFTLAYRHNGARACGSSSD